MENKKNNNKSESSKIALISIIILIIIIFVYILFNILSDHTEYIQAESTTSSISSLSCSANNSSKSFFNLSQSTSNKQEIKIAFKDKHISTIMYTLDASYDSEKTAKTKDAELHAEYSHYLSEHGLNTEQISNTFAFSESNIKIKLFTEKNSLNSITSELFLLDSVNYSHSSQALKAYYESIDFVCHYKD